MPHLPSPARAYISAAIVVGCVLLVLCLPHASYWVVPLTFAPIYVTCRTYSVYMARIEEEQAQAQKTSDLHLATLEALARAIDAKDRTTRMHVRRMQVYATGLAKAAGMTPDGILAVKTAALLHDIGKLAVPEHILTKPGPLTHEEFQKIRIHSQVGADIVAAVPFPYPVAPLILSHHERWDGHGYPEGLAGEQIPLGARVITVVDYFDAVSTERPHHKALSRETALGLLQREAGRALDPRLVPLFAELLPSLTETLALEQRPEPVAASATQVDVSPVGGPVGNPEPAQIGTALENIALAHREISALYEIAQSMGTILGVADTMDLISSKLTKLVPWSSCALFLYQAETDALTCRFATGLDASRILHAELGVGRGVASAVARDRRMLMNIDPQLLFDAASIPGDTELRSAILCPLYYEDAFIGCLALSHTDPRRYAEDHRRLLEQVSEQAGAVIHNSLVFERTQEDSLTDPLTGLPNRRSLFTHLTRELSRAERLKSTVSLVILDIDGFKAVNDTYGHHVGDAALREVSVALRATLRPYDLSVRYAGDEFIVVLDDCGVEAAAARLHELQERIGQITIEVGAGQQITLGASAGAAVYPVDGTTYETLLAQADHRMYRNKAARRKGAGAARPTGRSRRLTAAELTAELFEATESVPGPASQIPA